MVSEPSSSTVETSDADRGSSTLINAVIGAAAGVILSFVPLSTLLGGALAAYLEGGTANDGVRVGAIAGVIMLIPMLFMGMFGMMFFLGFGIGGVPRMFLFMLLPLLVFGSLYTVGLSAVGGYLGIYLKHEL
ncbi:DUF5518 domain-containing protein [Natrinema sp. 1APR25-10V2]|uniref:DUF5518 domain-containing protein n=1 Tax=Natrinema sp. 1APR25-10V2 TaxID=2951081 RepID=UPI0028758AE8|nr:DUF5518 domain-containing protein [Natrinema sp. 1APR25-10V2]MDS0476891.1 DUF5518 domain-containing protein [Natrinema sp. 1APR25-10V2]